MSWPGAVSVGMPRPLSLDPDAAVLLQRHRDAGAVAGQRLVDGVVDDLPDQVVQAALAGGADVHAGALADRLEPLEDLDRGGVVLALLDRVALAHRGQRGGGLGHPSAGMSVFGDAGLRCWSGGCWRASLQPRAILFTSAHITKVDPGTGKRPSPVYPVRAHVDGCRPSAGGRPGPREAVSRPHRAASDACAGARSSPCTGPGPQIGSRAVPAPGWTGRRSPVGVARTRARRGPTAARVSSSGRAGPAPRSP